VFTVDATLGGKSDAIGQRVAPVVSHVKEPVFVKEPVLAGSVSISGIPEPGVVALLGLGLVLVGFSYGRANVGSSKVLHRSRTRGENDLPSLRVPGGRIPAQFRDK
jgi:hypothetical protein